MAEQMDPEAVGDLLNEHFTEMSEIVFQYEGLVDKYIGDTVNIASRLEKIAHKGQTIVSAEIASTKSGKFQSSLSLSPRTILKPVLTNISAPRLCIISR